jgi:dipeptidyl aminopeptidase/acylaminoacyl peptidase
VLPPRTLGSGRWPLVLAVHGGPHWPAGWRFSFEYQRLAARGMVVCIANPRGSQGYGVAFARSNQGAWGGDDFADVMAVARAAAARADVDPGRLVITGVSYGGYMTCWTVGHTGMFRAAIAENSVIDLVSWFGTTDDGGSMAAVEFGGTPWDNPDFYRERSPVTHAADMTTPLLLVHAELDQGCPIGQSEQLFSSLRRLGRDVEMLRIPGEGHLIVLTGSVAHRLQRWAAIDTFLDGQLNNERSSS